MSAEEIECNRWSYTDLDEKCLQKFDVWDSVPVNSAFHHHHQARRRGGREQAPLLPFSWGSMGSKSALFKCNDLFSNC